MAIIDDHALFGASLAMLLRQRGFVTFHPPVTGGTAGVVAHLQRSPPGVALLDLHLGHDDRGYAVDGAELIEPLRALGWVVLVLTDDRHPAQEAAAIAAGAIGTVPMRDALDTSLRTLYAAAAGGEVMSEPVRQEWMRRHHSYRSEQVKLDRRLAGLSRREREVLELLVRGQRAAGIAETFGVSLTTVRTQIRSVLAKLDVSSQLEAVALAAQPRGTPPGPWTAGSPNGSRAAERDDGMANESTVSKINHEGAPMSGDATVPADDPPLSISEVVNVLRVISVRCNSSYLPGRPPHNGP